jgi:Fe2+ or Zn2+ uptake regulation protein
MDTAMPAPTPDSTLTHALRSRGQRVTPQRLVIHRALLELDRHVTAEELAAAVGERLPNVSTPTMYATLELFAELGIVRRISLGSGADLWDPRTDEHDHMACRRCGRIEDVDAGVDVAGALRAARRRGFRAERAEVLVSGLCSRCAGGGSR